MKDSEIYLRAAVIVQDMGFPSCSAVACVTGDWWDTSVAAKKYAQIFRPYKTCTVKWGELWSEDYEERKQCRVLALLFMHEIAKDQERKK